MGFNIARDKHELWESATTEDIMNNPEKFGAPTFEAFAKKRDQIKNNHNQKFGNIDKGGEITNKFTKKQIYEIEGYRCKTLEEVERVALSMGLNLRTLNYAAEFLPLGGGQADVLVKFISQADKKKRDNLNGL